MPLPRKLAYRDRYVRLLTQTMSGGSSVLPPFQFPASGAGEFIVSLTEAEWVKLFSAVMTGADLSYPDESHEVVWSLLRNLEYPVPNIGFGFDSEVNLWGYEAVVVAGVATSNVVSTANIHNVLTIQTPPAINNKVRWTRFLAAGAWSYSYLYVRRSDGGIIDIYATPDTGGTVTILNNFDTRGVFANNMFQRGTFNLTKSEEYTIEIEVVATSLPPSAYANQFTLLQMWRT